MDIVQHIQTYLKQTLDALDVSFEGAVHLEHPTDLSHGDYSANIAMVLAPRLHKKPHDLAVAIVAKMQEQGHPYIQSIEVAGPGFINFFLNQDFFTQALQDIVTQGTHYGDLDTYRDMNILVEHSSPNLFKAFHIGHLMNNTIGESLARLYTKAGASVTTISYPSDVSLGIGKAVWQLLEYGVEKLDTYECIEDKIQFLGTCYTEGTRAYDEHPHLEKEIRNITQDIYEVKTDSKAYRAYLLGKDINLSYFKKVTERLGSHFDGYIYESEAGVLGKQLVLEHTPLIYSASDGAIIYEGEKSGLHTRVFINKEGNPTYEAKDTGLLKIKFDRYQPDLSLLVTDNQQAEYYKVVLDAAGNINPDWKKKTIHATHGRMQFQGQKMSSRLGNTPLVTDILGEVNKEVQLRASGRTLTEQESDFISIAALKYAILRTQAGKDINFDPDTSLSFEGDSGPYLQYTHARCISVINKAQSFGIDVQKMHPRTDDLELTILERYLYRFPEYVELAVRQRHPHHVVTYVTELAQYFNTWYGNTKLIDDSDDAPYKIMLVRATAQILKNSLWLLGIHAPDTM